MARLPRDSYSTSRAFTTAPALSGDLSAEVEPLRFGADERDTSHSTDTYRGPRTSRLRSLRGALVLATFSLALIAVTWTAWAIVFDAIAEGASTLALREGDGQAQPTATVALAAIALLGFIGAWWRGTHPQRPMRLSGDRGRMAVDAIAGQLRASILEMDEVREAEVRVENRGRSRVRVRAWLRVSPEARIDDILDGVDEAADWLVHHRLGLLLAEPPLADVKYDELDLRLTRPSSPGRARPGRDRTPDDEDA